jgi:DNA topoisomerase-2
MKKVKAKKIEEIYQELSPEQHVLQKSGMYLGSTKKHIIETWLYENDKMQLKEVEYIPAFLKLFDELLSNSVDESKRKGSKLNIIKINIKDNKITVYDNGGIPTEIHKGKKQYVAEMVFGSLRAGSNFDDKDERLGVGTNGIGSVLVNLFSLEFVVTSCDGKKKFHQVFKNNMSERSKPNITESTRAHTEISYLTDFKRLDMKGIDDIHLSLIYKRILDSAGINPNIKFYFNDVQIKTRIFSDYIRYYTSDYIIDDTKHRWQLAVAPSDIGFKQISFINGATTMEGGTHVEHVLNQIITKVREFILKKHKIDVKPSEIKNHMFLFLNAEVVNPIFNSQTKEKLVSEVKDFGTEYIVSDKFIQSIIKSEIVKSVLDWYQQKKEADENKELRKLNKSLSTTKIEKLIDAKSTSNRDKCELFIIEGDSAAGPIKKYRNPTLQGSLALRGKFTNVMDVTTSKLMQDEQILNIMGALGLKLGEEPKNLRYGKIYITVDADFDGSAIAASLMNFFYKFWKKLFIDGNIYLNITPLLVVINKKNKNRIYFYNDKDFIEWQKKNNVKDYDIDFKKGLASLNDLESKKMLEEPKLVQLKIGANTKDVLYTWFGDNTQLRKDQLVDK